MKGRENAAKMEKEKMEWNREFFYDEVQEGFYVPGIMKRSWGAQLEILSEIDRICKKWDISYYMAYGSLLGAIRHRGFIPWDDDIDIMMFRTDYDKFRQLVQEEMSEDMFFTSIESDANRNSFIAAVCVEPIIFSQKKLRKFHEFPHSTAIDIFVLDELSGDEEDEKFRKKVLGIFTTMLSALECGKEKTKAFCRELHKIEELLHIQFDKELPLKSQFYQIMDRIFQEFNGEGGREVVYFPKYCNFDVRFPKSAFKETEWLSFCDKKVPVPKDYDTVLRAIYKDYKKEVKGGGDHNYPYFKELERKIQEKYNIKWQFLYSFSDDDLIRPAVHSFREVVLKTADYLLASERRIYQQLIEKNPEACLMELSRCQEEAIAFGNAIEVKKGEGTESVSILEQYCETLYLSYQSLSKAVNREVGDTEPREKETDNNIEAEIEKKLKRQAYYLKKLRSALEKEFKKQVVFLPHSAKHFASLRPLIDALYAAGDVDCKIIPIPYLDRLGDGSLSDMHYEGAEFPKEYEITDYRTYDFAKELPDAIVINSPYDECNPVWTVDPFFYSKELKKYTNKLIYIPWFVTDEIDPKNEEDGKAFVNMDYYVTVPGIFHADLTIVQSKEMKKAYLAKISKFSNGDIRKRMNKKISGAGSCLLGDKEGQGTKEVVAKFRHFLGRK